MAQISLFYDAVKTSEDTWDRECSAEDFALFFSTLYRNGVVMPVRDAFQIKPASTGGMRVVVSSGAANINGYQFINTEDFAIEIAVASASQSRTDSIGIQHNLGERETKIYYKQGDVSVTQQDDVWELQLAQINVIRNAVEITASNIKDMRADENVCGYASPYMDVPVSGLEQQYEDLLAAMYTQFGVDFTAWFEDIKGQLSTDAAGNLQNQINELDSQVTSGISTLDKKIDDVDSSVVHKTGDETVEGLKNFQDGLQIGGETVGLINEACWCEDYTVNNLAAGIVNPDILRFNTSNPDVFSASGKVITIKKTGVYLMALGVNYTGLTGWVTFGISRTDGTSLVNRNLLEASTAGSNSLTYVRRFSAGEQLVIEFNSGKAGITMKKINLAFVKLA